MEILFVHQNFPAQFGHIACHLVRTQGWSCTFVSQTPPGQVAGLRKIQYQPAGGARRSNHYCSRTFENAVWHAHGVYEACKAHPGLRPDLIVGHSGFGSTLFLSELYQVSLSSTTSSTTTILTAQTWISGPIPRLGNSISSERVPGTP